MSDKKEEVLAEIERRVAQINKLQSELKALMDAAMPMFSKFQIGDEIFNQDGHRVGVVSKLYRYWGNHQQPYLDTSMEINVEYDMGQRCFGNTSSEGGVWAFYTREGIAKELERKAADLRRPKHWWMPDVAKS